MQSDISILFIGDSSFCDFSRLASCLVRWNATIEADVARALARIKSGFAPAVIVVAQPWPEHISSKQIELLRQAAPLARIVSLLGTWLEGNARTGKPWPAVWRTYWHNWLPRFAADLDRLATGEETIWSLPLTAGDDERLLLACSEDKATRAVASPAKTIAVITANRETAESLGDICRDRGWKWVWLKTQEEEFLQAIDLAVFDARNLSESEISQISNLKSQISDVPLIILAGFPRIEDLQRLQTIDVAAVVSKPFLTRELVWQIEQVLGNLSHAAA